MKNKQKIFIAREYMITDDYGGMRIDEEEIFLSFSDARNFLKTLEDENVEGNQYLLFRTEILEFAIGQTKSYTRKWTFNLKGDLIDVIPPINNNQEKVQSGFTGKYKVGDIVFILPRIQSKFSPSVKGVYGVIVDTPHIILKQRLVDKNEDNINRAYVVYYISENGFLNHFHVIESAMITPNTVVPNEFKFIELYSKYLKKEIDLPDDLVAQILNENIFVKKIKSFTECWGQVCS
jgi:hypothetical protein